MLSTAGAPAYDTSLEEWIVGYVHSNFEGEIQSWINRNSPVTAVFDGDKLQLIGQHGWMTYSIGRSVFQARRDSEWYYQHDPKYKAVMDIAMRLCEEYDYDWGRFISKPEYAKFASDKRVLRYQETSKLPKPPKYGVCDDYAHAVVNEAAALPFVKEVRKWHAPSHAFNELVLDDDRHLWVDVTWMDNDGDYSYGKFDTENITYDLPVFEEQKSISGGLSHKERDGFTSAYNPAFYSEITPIKQENGRSGSSRKVLEFAGSFGIYLNGWHENLFSAGFPLQLGLEFNFANMALAVLGEGGVGAGSSSFSENLLLEWNYGGAGEFYFPRKKIGLGLGYGIADSAQALHYGGDESGPDLFNTTYTRFGFIFRGTSKTTLYAQRYGDGNWGFGLQWGGIW